MIEEMHNTYVLSIFDNSDNMLRILAALCQVNTCIMFVPQGVWYII